MAQFMVILDATVVNVALPSIQQDLEMSPSELQWVVNSYTLIFGGFLLAIVAYGLFLTVRIDWPYAAMFPSLIIAGIAFALAYGPLTIAATDEGWQISAFQNTLLPSAP